MRRLVPLLAVLATCGVAACASGRAVPRPFPGAALPPVTTQPGTPDPQPQPAAPPPVATLPPPSEPASPSDAELTPPLVATALLFRGTPYRNGGSDPAGFDCSGFVQYVFAQYGRALPRDVHRQFTIGDPIELADVRPGDLVFFETVSRGASHVGIALGNDQFLHAPSSRGVVRIERYTLDYWSKRYVGARRVTVTPEPVIQ